MGGAGHLGKPVAGALTALRRIALAIAGIALVAALWIGGQSMMKPADRGNETGPKATGATRLPEAPRSSKTPASVPPGKAPHIRLIAPDSIAGPRVEGPLERMPARAPLATATRNLKREPFGPPVPQGTLLYRAIAPAAGQIEANGYAIRLAGIKVLPADHSCPGEAGKSWPCGAMARTAFRAWMRGRAIACDIPSKPMKITTRCTLETEDMALWLVRNGWAESADDQYGDAEAEARRGKKGMFGPSPLGAAEE